MLVPVFVPPSQFCSVAAVGSGGAVVLVEREKAYVVWLSLHRDVLFALCSCGGRRGAESVEVRELMDLSSSCVHARALLASSEEVTNFAGLPSVRELLLRFSVLNNARTARSYDRVVNYATHTRRKRGAFAVLYNGMWTTVVIRERRARAKTKSGHVLRPACLQLSCAKDHWWCLHAKAVWDWYVAALAPDNGAAWPVGVPADVRLVDLSGAAPVQPPSPGERLADEARCCDETRWRAARSFLPCAGELDDCELFDSLADAGRSTGRIQCLDTILYEDRCFKCGAGYSGMSPKNTGAVLHTLRDRVSVRLQQ